MSASVPIWKSRGLFLLLAALPVVLRLWWLIHFLSSPLAGVQGGDMRFYHEWGLRIAQGDWTDHHAFYGLPGYAFLLAGIYRVLAPATGVAVIVVLQTVLSLATGWIVWRLARRAWPEGKGNDYVGLGAAYAWFFFVPGIGFSLVLMPTTWLVCAYWACVLWALRAPVRAAWWQWLGLGVFVGMVATMVATILFVLPLLAAAARRLPRRAALGALLALGAGVAGGTSPAWLHNRFVAREPAFLSAHGGINFWIGNHPGANGYPAIPPGLRSGQQELLDDSIRLAEEAAGHPLTRPEVSRYWSGRAWAEIRREPARWVRLLGLKLRALWAAFEYDDVSILPLFRENGLIPRHGVLFGTLAALGLPSALLGLWKGGPARWVAAAVLLHLAALLPVFVTERYRLAAAPGLAVLLAYGVATVWREVAARRWLVPGVWLAAVALTLCGLVLPAPAVSVSSMQPYNVALSELEALDSVPPGPVREQLLAFAYRNLQEAERHAPNSAPLWFAYGRYWTARLQPDQAKANYRRAIEQDGAYVDAYINLGIIALQEERWDIAERLFAAALKLNPKETGAAQLLQLARQKQGR